VTVAAVIPHWNRRDLLAALLENLKRQTQAFDQIIVADNGSTDDSAEIADRAGAFVLRLGANLGFAAAVNRGIEAASCDWVAILNNDVTLDPGWLAALMDGTALMDGAGRDRVWFAAGKILSAAQPEILDGGFDEVARSGCAWRCGAGRPDSPIWDQPRRIRIAPMTAALFRRDLFDRAGLLDELFGPYGFEDVDFGIRCSLEGLKGIYIPGAMAYHRGSATLGRWNKDTVRFLSRNQMLLALKYLRGQRRWPILAGQLLWGCVALRHGCLLPYLRGRMEARRFKAVGGRAQNKQTWAPEAVRVLLEESERTIFDLQQQTGFELYWRLYFWLSRRSL
jgi:GT2 family glycosyltransferase